MPPTIHVPIPTLRLLHVPLADDMCGVSTEVAGVWNTSDFDHVLHHVTFAVSVVGEGQGLGGGGESYMHRTRVFFCCGRMSAKCYGFIL